MKAIALGLVLVLASCLPGPLGRATDASKVMGAWADTFHRQLAIEYESAQQACVDAHDYMREALICIRAVRSAYDPIWEDYQALRTTWLTLSSVINSYRITGQEPDVDQVRELMAKMETLQARLTKRLLELQS